MTFRSLKIMLFSLIYLFALLGSGCDEEKKSTKDDTTEEVLCNVAELKCYHGDIYICTKSGQWELNEDCGELSICDLADDIPVCVDYNSILCTEGETYCQDNNVYTCSSKNFWEILAECNESQTCTFIDDVAVCKDNIISVCDIEEVKCENNKIYNCDEQGQWELLKECGEFELCEVAENQAKCVENIPVTCEEGKEVCIAGSAYKCDENGDWILKEMCIDGKECLLLNDVAECIEGVCEPGEEKCNEGNIFSCNEQNEWVLKEECSDGLGCAKTEDSVNCIKLGESCDNPVEFDTLPELVQGSTLTFINDIEPVCDNLLTSSGPDVVYKFTLGFRTLLTVVMVPSENTNKDMLMYLMDECTDSSNSCLAVADNPESGERESLSYINQQNNPIDLYLIVDGLDDTDKGDFALTFNTEDLSNGIMGETCESDVYCKAELFCNTELDLCTKQCNSSFDCEEGFNCVDVDGSDLTFKQCLNSNLLGKVENKDTCEFDWQCNSNLCYTNGSKSYCTKTCLPELLDCPRRMQCVQNVNAEYVCVEEQVGNGQLFDNCSSNGDCAFEYECVNNSCTVTQCLIDNDCPFSYIFEPDSNNDICWSCSDGSDCEEGYCVELKDGKFCSPKCSDDSDCVNDSSCTTVSGTNYGCVPELNLCSSGLRCANVVEGDNFCKLPHGKTGYSCKYNADCLKGICEQGICSLSCLNDSECICSDLQCGSNGHCKLDSSSVLTETESNNNFLNAQSILLNSSIRAELAFSDESDVDYYSFFADLGDVITIQTSMPCAYSIDTALELYNNNLEKIAENDDENLESGLYTSLIYPYIAEYSGKYYIKVSGSNQLVDGTGPYYLSIIKAERLPVGSICALDYNCEQGLLCSNEFKVCTKECDGENDCLEGFICAQVNNELSALNICISKTLTRKLEFGQTCKYNWQCENLNCFEDETKGNYCSKTCNNTNLLCPDNFECKNLLESDSGTNSENDSETNLETDFVCVMTTLKGDTCLNPFTINELSYSVNSDTTYFTNYFEIAVSCTSYANYGKDAIYQITIPKSKKITATVVPSDWDVSAYLIDSCVIAYEQDNCLAGSDILGKSGTEEIVWTNSSDTDVIVYLVIDASISNDYGAYELLTSIE